MDSIREKLYIHAVKRRSYEIHNDLSHGVENPAEFRYMVSTCEEYWDDEAVCIGTREIVVPIPEVDCRQLLIKKLRKDKEAILADSQEKLNKIDDQIRQLSALTYTGS
jgi:hypothetical protein